MFVYRLSLSPPSLPFPRYFSPNREPVHRLEIATLNHQKLISKKLETVEMSLTGVLGVIFEVDEEEEGKE